MKIAAYGLALFVAFLNIYLHVLASGAAGSWNQRLLSKQFLLAFAVGSLSLIAIFVFYYAAGSNVARGLLLMGSASIIGGSLYGIVILGNRLELIDGLLFALLSAVYLWQAVKEVAKTF